jgi:pimeloyl-ACP methyl ester carboxylesterase
MPVAVFAGEHDGIAPPQAVANMARNIPGAVCQFFDGGHLLHVQNKQAAAAIVSWIAGFTASP